MQLFGCLAVVETHTLWYFGHHCCLVVGFDALRIWHFWMFTLFHPFLPFCTHFLPISTTPTLFSVDCYGDTLSGCLLQDIILLSSFLGPIFSMDLGIGDRVFYTRCNGLRVPATVVGTAEDGLLHLEYYGDGLRVVNRQCKMESISFAIPSLDSPPDCPPSPPPNTQSSSPPKGPWSFTTATRTGKVPSSTVWVAKF